MSEYRDISRSWHRYLGFGVFLPPRGGSNPRDVDEALESRADMAKDTRCGAVAPHQWERGKRVLERDKDGAVCQ